MIKTYILVAWRSLLKNRLFSFINIFGLALSMSVCMIVLLRLVDNFSYDTFHPAPGKTYRIVSGLITNNGENIDLATTPLPLKEALDQKDADIIRESVSIYPALHDNASDGAKQLPLHGAFTQPSFFRAFGFTLKHGDPATALVHPNSLVLSEEVSENFFGTVNPVGKLLTLDKLGAFLVTGVMNRPPNKSHINYQVLASASSVSLLEKDRRLPAKLDQWDTFEEAYTYVMLNDHIPEPVLAQKLAVIAQALNQEGNTVRISFTPQPVSSITPGWTQRYHETSPGSSWSKLITEVGIALIILVAACFNYTNLSIARALTRGKEVGIRKLAGAMRWQIFAQYITEAVIISICALLLAHVFLSFILEYKPFNDGYELVPDTAVSFKVFLIFLLFAVFAGLMAGAMPAWILSAFKPARVLRSVGVEKIMGSLSLRKVLMVFQFSLSLVILIFLTAFYRQFTFIGTADSGFTRSNILIVPFSGNGEILATHFGRISGVEALAFASDHFGKYTSGSIHLYEDSNLQQEHPLNYYSVDAALISMMGLEIVAGDNFPSGGSKNQYILINEKAARALGFWSASAALGANFYLADSTSVQVKGVVRDFYHRSVGHNIEPLVFLNSPADFRQLLIRVEPSAHEQINGRLASAWKNVYQEDQVFTATWFDEKIAALNDQSASISLLGFLAFMAVAIASLGLLGLVVYTVETRRKEISIRKIIGASVAQILLLLSNGYMKLLILSGIIALPIGYLLSTFFLMQFANRISFGIGSLMISFLLLLTIGLVTILSQTFQASTENPSRNLRSE